MTGSMYALSSGAIVGIAIAAAVVLGALLVVVTARRSDVRGAGALSRETASRDRSSTAATAVSGREVERSARGGLATVTETAPVEWVAPEAEQIGMTRRHFFNVSMITLMTASLGGFGAAVIAFLWPSSSGGFGGKVPIGKVDDVLAVIKQGKGFGYFPNARAWVTEYPASALPKARSVYPAPVLAGMEAGLAVLWQKCPHLGCRVPQCETSQWFECPCHGSQYNRAGEKKAGPAPRGMDRFGVEVSGGNVVVNTGLQLNGPAIGVNTTGQEAEGPHCITGGGGH
ncbi:MAG: ubiquinol-cytochrome c reductase iron-sulfur subunit [Ilumatobacteraceae bacterium]